MMSPVVYLVIASLSIIGFVCVFLLLKIGVIPYLWRVQEYQRFKRLVDEKIELENKLADLQAKYDASEYRCESYSNDFFGLMTQVTNLKCKNLKLEQQLMDLKESYSTAFLTSKSNCHIECDEVRKLDYIGRNRKE